MPVDMSLFHASGRLWCQIHAPTCLVCCGPWSVITWDDPLLDGGAPDAAAVLQEVNGCHLIGEKHGQLRSTFVEMNADCSTAGGCWIYTGVYADGVNQAARRKPGSEQSWVAAEWGWAWPMNRRILYNRASADPDGKPWSGRKT